MTPERPLAADGARMVADLRELARLTSDAGGAQRVAWTPTWTRARSWLRERLAACGLTLDLDPAGNGWATRPGRPGTPTLLLGSHLDSVPDGGWLDGALGVVAALELLRAAAEQDWEEATLVLVDWADEEGSRFGHSLLGSSAATGLLDLDAVARLRDRDGLAFPAVAQEHGVTLAEMPRAAERLAGVDALLELHIEQGPVLEAAGAALGVPTGAVAVERLRVCFGGQAAHAGTTPLALRHDAGAAASRLALSARDAARRAGGLATCGRLTLEPGIATAVAERAELLVDLRHAEQPAADALRATVVDTAQAIAADERVEVAVEPLWATPAVRFDGALVAALADAVAASGVAAPSLVSGALHDAVAVARSGVPAAMLFVRSIGGISHNRIEDSGEDDLAAALAVYAAAVEATAARLTAPR
ncbi:MAG: Zn-dependent hydrolase [Actinomycetota bacterium]